MYFSLIFLLTWIMPLLIMPKEIKAGRQSPYEIVVRAILFTTAIAALIFMAASMNGQGVYSELYSMMETVSEQAASNEQAARAFGMGEASQESRAETLMALYGTALQQMPVCILFMSAVIAYLEYILLSRIMGKRRDVKKMPKFREFSFPNGMAMAVMVMYLIALVMVEMEAACGGSMYVNMDLFFDLVFSVQGISVVLMFVHMKRGPQAVGVVIAAVLWLTYIGRLLLMMLGIFDLMLGLKKRIQGRSSR